MIGVLLDDLEATHFVSGSPSAGGELNRWLEASQGTAVASLLAGDVANVAEEIVQRYDRQYPEERYVISLIRFLISAHV